MEHTKATITLAQWNLLVRATSHASTVLHSEIARNELAGFMQMAELYREWLEEVNRARTELIELGVSHRVHLQEEAA